ncbi:STAS domain-containing protein [Streptomyces sp. CA-111067]|uniref:STAS domain-containing protein n=1 Tax=Streptomyces sp. CA-111067 TaxID=3240046 RepID=UPI003D962E6D
MSDQIPVLQIGKVLLVSIQTDLDDNAVTQLQDDLADQVITTGAYGVVIDITAVEIVDSFVGRMLATIASICRMLDAETVVVGMRPAVAITLVELGLSMGGVKTALNLDNGLQALERARARRHGGEREVDAGDVRTSPASW